MTSKKRHQKVADQFKELNAKLNKKKDEYLEKISKNINKAVKNYEDKKQWKQYYNEIVNLFYAALTDTYLLTAIALKEIYGQISDNIPNIEDFLYTEDDKTLPERLKQYWDEALSLLKNSQTDPQEIALYLLSMYDRILTTEMQNVKTGVKQTKKPIRETDIEVIIITDG